MILAGFATRFTLSRYCKIALAQRSPSFLATPTKPTLASRDQPATKMPSMAFPANGLYTSYDMPSIEYCGNGFFTNWVPWMGNPKWSSTRSPMQKITVSTSKIRFTPRGFALVSPSSSRISVLSSISNPSKFPCSSPIIRVGEARNVNLSLESEWSGSAFSIDDNI